ncbi:MAG: O-antigen ligase family protein [Candidatus Euphemobacter frigidus]|nr:O-antigen ligase family protein [Candidatus Euphemobacter frigidus]MDP8275180.1 O-antigen ligase family protein [Candidatus Euphemobacter frigidus]
MNNFTEKYRLGLRILLLVIIFFIGVGQVSLNKERGEAVSLEQPAFRLSLSSLSGIYFSVGGKIRNLLCPLLILWAAGWIWDRRLRPKRTILKVPLLVFMAVSLLAYFFSPLREISWAGGTRELLLGGFFFFAAAALLTTERSQKIALATLFVAVVLSALAGIYLFSQHICFPPTPHRIWLSFMHPNTTGSALLLLIPLGVAMIMDRNPGWVKTVGVLITVILTVAMVLTFSRTAWLSLLIAMAVLAFYWKGKYKFYFLTTLVLLAVLLILGVNIGPQSYLKERVESFSAFKTDPNIHKRIIYWDGVTRMIGRRPILGYGPGHQVFMAAYETWFKEVETGEKPVHAHNMYLSLAAATGIAGLGAFLWLLAASFCALRTGRRTADNPFSRSFFRGMTAGLAGFLIGGLADNPFFSFRLVLVFWFLLALVVARSSSQSSPEI